MVRNGFVVCTSLYQNMVTLPPSLVSTNYGTCSYQCSLSNCTPVSLHMLKCSWAHTVSCIFMYCCFAMLKLCCLFSKQIIIIIIIIIQLNYVSQASSGSVIIYKPMWWNSAIIHWAQLDQHAIQESRVNEFRCWTSISNLRATQNYPLHRAMASSDITKRSIYIIRISHHIFQNNRRQWICFLFTLWSWCYKGTDFEVTEGRVPEGTSWKQAVSLVPYNVLLYD